MLKSQNSHLAAQPRPHSAQSALAQTAEELPASGRPDAFVIDDEEGICRYITTVLGMLGLAAESMHSAEQVMAALERVQPDIVFLDIALGESDAVDVIRKLGALRYRGIVQLMSGAKSALLDDVHRIGALHGLNMCPPLEKPFRREAIQRAIATLPLFARSDIAVSAAPQVQPGLDVALANNWLELWYQPKIDLRTGGLAGVEGLVRYSHPKLGVHPIDSMLPQASTETRARLIQHFLIRALHDWEELDSAGISVRTAVNANVDVLTNVDLTGLVRQNRPRSTSWPGLILEISENEVIRDLNLAHEIATQLRIYDITLAISNFGAGFSSFERLRELPFSELKLHPGFVAGCADDARNAGICRASIELAHRFEVMTVADGLDNASDLHALQYLDCDAGQGPFLAEPMPKSQFISSLRERARTNQAWLA
jgi:EAL domain-containing protein (putative c-di-GMP-specific phosphodiesterase class I)/CheY-like chemotaxis protein